VCVLCVCVCVCVCVCICVCVCVCIQGICRSGCVCVPVVLSNEIWCNCVICYCNRLLAVIVWWSLHDLRLMFLGLFLFLRLQRSLSRVSGVSDSICALHSWWECFCVSADSAGAAGHVLLKNTLKCGRGLAGAVGAASLGLVGGANEHACVSV